MRLAFIEFRSFRVGFIRGYRYHNYTTNWAKTKEILREWGLKLRESLKMGGYIIRNPLSLLTTFAASSPKGTPALSGAPAPALPKGEPSRYVRC